MSHAPETAVVCPNCNYPAQRNYCAECGQPTHLHTETFPGMVGHFIAHYFHYESKFWQTLVSLWTKPGKLTVAYRSKQIVRYTAPMSLYIFVVAAFVVLSTAADFVYTLLPYQPEVTTVTMADRPSFESAKDAGQLTNDITQWIWAIADSGELDAKTKPYFSNIAFFMVPVFAAMLSIVFCRRRDLNYADHIIFSLHIHTFLFSCIFLLMDIIRLPDDYWNNITTEILLLGAMVYIAAATRKVYNVNGILAGLISAVSFAVYMIILFAVSILVVLLH